MTDLARHAGLGELTDAWLGGRLTREPTLVAGLTAGADSIDDIGVLRHGAMDKVLGPSYAPSTLG